MSEVKRNEITAEGLKALKDRLEYLKTTGRAQISELIATARSFGDLSVWSASGYTRGNFE